MPPHACAEVLPGLPNVDRLSLVVVERVDADALVQLLAAGLVDAGHGFGDRLPQSLHGLGRR
jgi:hypothetical protein